MRTRRRVIGQTAMLFLMAALLLVAAGWPAPAEAQQASGMFTGVNGQVEVQKKGQTAWQPARIRMAVTEGDQVRALPGGNAELRLPDGSTVFVAENTRFAVTKLDYGANNQMRSAYFHLAVGKIRGVISKAAAALVAARQGGGFAISTPTAVAAVRGTTVFATFDPATGITSYLVTEGTAVIKDMATGQSVTVTAGQITTVVSGQAPTPPAPATPAQVQQATSPAQPVSTAGQTTLQTTVISVPSAATIEVQVGTPTTPTAPPPVTVVVPPPPPPTVTNPSGS